jgi:predicted nucleotidyltransferase
MTKPLLSYSIDFISFLLQNIKEKKKIERIILFGSVARDDFTKDSDIDLFIDTPDEKLKDEIDKSYAKFLDSSKYKNYWKLLGISNEIKFVVGKFDEWKNLQPSILSDGIILYGKFTTPIKEGRYKTFFIWENIKPNSKRVLLNKQLLGYTTKSKYYTGLLEKCDGEKIGKGIITVPLKHSSSIHSFFKKNKITVKIKQVLDYSK